MITLRGLLIFLRILGIFSLALALYVWAYPVSLSRWIGPGEQQSKSADVKLSMGKTDFPVLENYLEPVRVSRSQAAQALWLGEKYRVVPEAVEILLFEADRLSKSYRLSPNLIIAVMAIESNFHPFIESRAGAQGLMQVMPLIHAKRYVKLGGKSIDPMVNLKVGAEILRDCVKLKGGSEDEGLRFYFGGGAASDSYIEKVRGEQDRLRQVAAGIRVPVK